VRYDNTSERWLLRHVVRVVAQALPVVVVAFVLLYLFTPASAGLLVAVLVAGLLISLFFTIGTARDLAIVRLAKHGFPPGTTPPPSRLLPEDAGEEMRRGGHRPGHPPGQGAVPGRRDHQG
jgi:hypothetical protein